jgi:hypothetical protein
VALVNCNRRNLAKFNMHRAVASSKYSILKEICSSGRTRTCNPSVNSRTRHANSLPSAVSCYKPYPLCSLVQTAFSSLATNTPEIMPYFEVKWAQKWAQSFGVNPSVETNWNLNTCPSLNFRTQNSIFSARMTLGC